MIQILNNNNITTLNDFMKLYRIFDIKNKIKKIKHNMI